MKGKAFCLFIYLFLFSVLGVRTTYAQVVINEFSSFESSGDWAELFSPSDIDISGYILRDNAQSKVETIPANTLIGPSTSSYFVIEAGNRLNVDEDVIKLLTPDDQTVVDEITYGSAESVCAPQSGGSIARIPDGGDTIDRLETSTKGLTNGESITNPCPSPTPVPTQTSTVTPQPTNTLTPTLTPKPTQTNTPSPTKKPTATPTITSIPSPSETITPLQELSGGNDPQNVLGASGVSSDENLTVTDNGGNSVLYTVFPYILTGFGVILTGYAGYSLFKSRRNDEQNESN